MRDYAGGMDEPREAIFITEVLQDGRASNIMAMLTGSLVLATAVFSLLAAQAWARSRARSLADGSAWPTALHWQASGDLHVQDDGTLEFGPSGGSIDIPLSRATNPIDVKIMQLDSTIDLSRVSLTVIGEGGKSITLAFTPSRIELRQGRASSEGRLLAWSSGPCSVEGIGSVGLSLSGEALQVLCGETVALAYPELPLGSVTDIHLEANPGPAFAAGLSIR